MASIGIEAISLFGLPPVETVNLAADLGCTGISTGLTSFPSGVADYPPFSLRDDPALRREMIAVMTDRGVSISLGEGLNVRAGTDIRDLAGDLAIFHELGVRRVNTVSLDSDLARSFDQFAVLAEMTAEAGVELTIELSPPLVVNDLPTALAVLRHVNLPHFKLLIDTMHVVRSGATAADIAALDPALIGYVQICDAPRVPTIASYMEESMYERMIPGEGELGLRDIVAALPHDRFFSIEVPQRSEALAGKGPRERLGKCVEATRRLLAETEN